MAAGLVPFSTDRDDVRNVARLLFLSGLRDARFLFGRDEFKAVSLITSLMHEPASSFYHKNIYCYFADTLTGVVLFHPPGALSDDLPVLWKLFGPLQRLRLRAWRSAIKSGTAAPEQNKDQLHVSHICIQPWLRRRGHALALVEALKRLAVEQGYSRLSLDVEPVNQAAMALYGRGGFKRSTRWHTGFPLYARYWRMGFTL